MPHPILESILSDDSHAWEQMNALRAKFKPEVFNSLDNSISAQKAIDKGISVVTQTLYKYSDLGIEVKNVTPSHGPGHMVRDYVNALSFLPDMQVNSGDIFVGLVSGTLHDTGCALVDRYQESKRALKHAEVGALLFYETMADMGELSESERTAIAWSIAAHTHYLTPQKSSSLDKSDRILKPYQDLDEEGKPIIGVWFPRWVDRLDCNGPAFPARHYLTLVDSHQDFSGDKFVEMSFSEQMRVGNRRNSQEIKANGGKRTMLEHLELYLDSQDNSSAYGKHDFGKYLELREESRRMLGEIINSSQNFRSISREEEKEVLDKWDQFLIHNIEPSPNTIETVLKLRNMFENLDSKTREIWCNVFSSSMQHYKIWAKERMKGLNKTCPQKLYLPGISFDVRNQIDPRY